MEKLVDKGKVRSIGISNFILPEVEELLKTAKIVPAVNQIEAYSPLGNNVINKTKLVDYDAVRTIADELGATTAQVLIAWGAYEGCSVIPKSVQESASSFLSLSCSRTDD